MIKITKPTTNQHPDWAPVYIDLVPDDGQVLAHLQVNLNRLMNLIEPLSEEQLLYRYADGKWTIKETLVHLMDVEQVFSYRALGAARGDKTNLPGFDHNAYVPNSGANNRTKASIIHEYRSLRAATVAFFEGLPENALDIIGTAKDQPCTAKAMLYMITGHELHHTRILVERYLNSME